MKILMLGTGAADGWPTPFCTCASCLGAAAAGRIRRQTSALIDDTVLLDCGAETARSAVQAGRRLDGLRLVLFTHAHPDHCDPQALLWRAWAELREPLVVAGPADALDLCRPWIGPDDPIELHGLVAGSTLEVAGYTIRAVAATHTPGALLYDVTGPDGGRLLYATDTGPLGDPTLEALSGRRFDAALIEETWGDHTGHGTPHHDLETFASTVRALRTIEAIDDTTDVVAIHLGHRNPDEPELSRRLASWGARAVLDHDEIDTSRSVVDDLQRSGRPGAPPRRTLVLGGARSGKSVEAERIVSADERVVYLATATSPDDDDLEWAARVERHRRRRPAHWVTVESADVAGQLRSAADGTTLLVDCLTLWLTAELEAIDSWDDADSAIERFSPVLDDLVDALRTTRARVVLVSNEVGSGIVPSTASGRLFRDLLGRVNTAVAGACEQVLLVTAGRVQHL